MEIVKGLVKEVWLLFFQMSPYLFGGFLFAGIIHNFLKPSRIIHHLGKPGFISIAKAVLFGVPLPLCSCGVVPPAASLYKSGASKGATIAFLISTPTTGIDSIFATYGMLGGIFTLFRIAASIIIGFIAGLISDIFSRKTEKTSNIEVFDQTDNDPFLFDAIRYAFGELYGSVSKWIFWGVLIGGVISYFVPENIFSASFDNLWISYIIMLIFGLPLYVCATGSIPIAASLMAKGISPGACLIFLIAGPATNTVTMMFVGKNLGRKSFVIYLASIIAGSVLFGLVLDKFMIESGTKMPLLQHHHSEISNIISYVCSIFLISVSIFSIARTMKVKFFVKKAPYCFTFYIPDISCENCAKKITDILLSIEGVKSVDLNIKRKKVRICTDFPDNEKLKKILASSGYPVSQ